VKNHADRGIRSFAALPEWEPSKKEKSGGRGWKPVEIFLGGCYTTEGPHVKIEQGNLARCVYRKEAFPMY